MMNRQNRLIGLTLLVVVLVLVLYNSSDTSGAHVSLDRELTGNNVLNSNNNAKVDEAINNEIKLEKQTEEIDQDVLIGDKGGVVDDDVLDEGTTSGTKGSGSGVGAGVGAGSANENDLDLDTSFDPAKVLIQIRSISPMVVFSKTYCPYSKRLKKLLHDNYQITPEPVIVEIDKHAHGKVLQEYLGDISGRSTVPNVLVGTSNESKGGCDDFLNLHESGKLENLLNQWGNKKLDVKRVQAPSNM